MGPADDVTLGELARSLEKLAQDVGRSFGELRRDFASDVDRVERAVGSLRFVDPQVYAADKLTAAEQGKARDARLEKLEGTVQWLGRAIAGAIISGVVGAVLVATRGG